MANVSLEIVFGMLFFTLNSANIDFLDRDFWWKTYTTQKAFLTIKHVKLVRKKEFAATALNPEYKTFIVYIALFTSFALLTNSNIYLSRRSQMAGLIAEKAFIIVFAKYIDFVKLFFPDLTSKLPKYTRINNYVIKLVKDQQLFYGPIYSLETIKFKILKVYIEINLANNFIRLFKSLIDIFIFFK